ncbi:MAG: hypothetical protein SWC96_09735 [Thermodesulfobacteriota bacterium]|nr:hypothetical protein [Thermodesulfobacteriota bacterium]
MNASIDTILTTIGDTYKDRIDPRARHYLEINIGKQAEAMGLSGLPEHLLAASAIVPLKAPASGMKVRVDGRTLNDRPCTRKRGRAFCKPVNPVNGFISPAPPALPPM